MLKKILNNFSILSIICTLLLGLTAIHNKTFASNVQKNKCRIIESIKEETGYQHKKYEYDSYGNKTVYVTPYKNIGAKAANKTLEFIFTPIIDSKYSRSLEYYDYNDKRIWSSNCNNKNYTDCLQKKPVYKSYKDNKGNKKDTYRSPDGSKIYYWYIYNNKGQKIEEMDICNGNASLTCYTKHQYTYNSQGKISTMYKKRVWQKDKYSELYDKYIYDTKGNLIEHKEECNKDYTKCVHTTKCGYNNLGQKIKETWTWDLTKPSITTYKYDPQGNLNLENKCYNSTTNCLKKCEYDVRGNQIKEYKNCDNTGNNCNELYKYEYDTYNNKIAKYSCSPNGTNCKQVEKIKYECK